MKNYIDQLTQLKLSHSEALKHAQSFTDPLLSPEGIAKRRQELAANATADHKSKLESLSNKFGAEVAEAKRRAESEIPAPQADTSVAWSMAQMLLNAGQTLHQIIATADPALLHAVTQWGPTYLKAQALEGRNDPWSSAEVEPAPLQNSIRQRWAQILGDSAGERIEKGIEAESAAAEFSVSAEHFGNQLDGVRTGMDDLVVAVQASLAGKAVASGLQKESDAIRNAVANGLRGVAA